VLLLASEGTVCSGRQSMPYQNDRCSQATRKRQDRRAGAWYRIFCHKPHRRREKQRCLQIAMGAPAASIAIQTYSTPYQILDGSRREVVKLCCKSRIPASKGQSPAHCRWPPPAEVHNATTCLPTATTGSEDPKSLGTRCVIVEAAEAAPYCRLASPA
jgi:hypothetical protein